MYIIFESFIYLIFEFFFHKVRTLYSLCRFDCDNIDSVFKYMDSFFYL